MIWLQTKEVVMSTKTTRAEEKAQRSLKVKTQRLEAKKEVKEYEHLLHDLASEMKLFGRVSSWVDLD